MPNSPGTYCFVCIKGKKGRDPSARQLRQPTAPAPPDRVPRDANFNCGCFARRKAMWQRGGLHFCQATFVIIPRLRSEERKRKKKQGIRRFPLEILPMSMPSAHRSDAHWSACQPQAKFGTKQSSIRDDPNARFIRLYQMVRNSHADHNAIVFA